MTRSFKHKNSQNEISFMHMLADKVQAVITTCTIMKVKWCLSGVLRNACKMCAVVGMPGKEQNKKQHCY